MAADQDIKEHAASMLPSGDQDAGGNQDGLGHYCRWPVPELRQAERPGRRRLLAASAPHSLRPSLEDPCNLFPTCRWQKQAELAEGGSPWLVRGQSP